MSSTKTYLVLSGATPKNFSAHTVDAESPESALRVHLALKDPEKGPHPFVQITPHSNDPAVFSKRLAQFGEVLEEAGH